MAGSEAGNLDAYFFLQRTGTLSFDSHQRLATFFSFFSSSLFLFFWYHWVKDKRQTAAMHNNRLGPKPPLDLNPTTFASRLFFCLS